MLQGSGNILHHLGHKNVYAEHFSHLGSRLRCGFLLGDRLSEVGEHLWSHE